MIFRKYKDKDATLDYPFDWSNWLTEGDAINTATVTVEDGLVKSNVVSNDTTVAVWLSGGTVGESYEVVCEIETDEGRIEDAKAIIIVVDNA